MALPSDLTRSERRFFSLIYCMIGLMGGSVLCMMFYMHYAAAKHRHFIQALLPFVVSATQEPFPVALTTLASHVGSVNKVGKITVNDVKGKTIVTWSNLGEDACADVRSYLTKHPSENSLAVTKNGEQIDRFAYQDMECDRERGDDVLFTFTFVSVGPIMGNQKVLP